MAFLPRCIIIVIPDRDLVWFSFYTFFKKETFIEVVHQMVLHLYKIRHTVCVGIFVVSIECTLLS